MYDGLRLREQLVESASQHHLSSDILQSLVSQIMVAMDLEVSVEADTQGPGHVFLPFLVMEDLLDKLKLLDYDIEFVSDLKMRPLNRHYFVLQTNPGEQFFVFSSLCSWLGC